MLCFRRRVRQPHWCLDALRAQTFWGSQQYHYTAPVPGILALHEALRQICEETLPARFERHRVSSIALQAATHTKRIEDFEEIVGAALLSHLTDTQNV